MKDGLENIDEVFKQAFDGFEANVDPSVWTNIQQSISSGGVTPQADPVSSAVVSSTVKSVVVKIAATVLAVGTIATATYYIATSPSEKEEVMAENTIVEEAGAETPIEKEAIVITEATKEEKESAEYQMLVKDEVLDKETTELPVEKEENSIPEVEEPNLKNITDFGPSNTTSDEGEFKEDDNQKSVTPPVAKEDEKPEIKEGDAPVEPKTNPAPVETKKVVIAELIPNVFTPNGDGTNDAFKVIGEKIYEMELTIMDKSYNILGVLKSVEDEWGGDNMEGINMPTGSYFVTGVIKDKEGNTEVVRKFLQLNR